MNNLNNKIPIAELEILLCHVLNVERSFLRAHPENIINPEQTEILHNLITRRLNNEPIAYIIGNKHFWDFNLLVNQNVLIPRAETELLVEQVLNKLAINSCATILELGTGSGAISLAIAKERPNTIITAVDISISALNLAKINAQNLKITNINFLYGNWFATVPKLEYKFDYIISNPPYVAFNEINLCNQEVFYEPKIALFSAGNGFSCLKKIICDSQKYLQTNGYLFLEHGINQMPKLIELLQAAKFSQIESFKDLSGINRLVVSKNC